MSCLRSALLSLQSSIPFNSDSCLCFICSSRGFCTLPLRANVEGFQTWNPLHYLHPSLGSGALDDRVRKQIQCSNFCSPSVRQDSEYSKYSFAKHSFSKSCLTVMQPTSSSICGTTT